MQYWHFAPGTPPKLFLRLVTSYITHCSTKSLIFFVKLRDISDFMRPDRDIMWIQNTLNSGPQNSRYKQPQGPALEWKNYSPIEQLACLRTSEDLNGLPRFLASEKGAEATSLSQWAKETDHTSWRLISPWEKLLWKECPVLQIEKIRHTRQNAISLSVHSFSLTCIFVHKASPWAFPEPGNGRSTEQSKWITKSKHSCSHFSFSTNF